MVEPIGGICPETGEPHHFSWDQEYDQAFSEVHGEKTYNCENCGQLAPEGWLPAEDA